MEFEIPEEAKWVLEAGRRWFRGGSLKLDWWRLDSGCVNNKENVGEAWIRDSCVGNRLGDSLEIEGVVGKDLSEARGDGETKSC